VLVLPLLGSSRAVQGVLTVGRLAGRPTFTAEDLEMAAGFANQASIAIELADARAEQQKAVMFADRERIAADLHDHVIQRLFAAGLALQSIAATLPPDTNGSRSGATAAARLTGTIHDLDDTISQIRSTIFALHHLAQPAQSGLRGLILDVITEVTYTDEYPYDSASLKGATTTAKAGSKIGVNGGADVAFFLTRRLGLGFGAQYAGATIVLPMGSGAGTRVKVGGVQAGGGLRLRF